MRFQYSLQKIVDLKSNEKTQAEWMLSKAIGRLREEEASLSHLHAEKHSLQDELISASRHRAKISELLMMQHYLQHLERQIDEQLKEVQTAQTDVAHKQEKLTLKMLEERVWTKAKEKAYEKYRHVMTKKEQSELDEIAALRHANTN